MEIPLPLSPTSGRQRKCDCCVGCRDDWLSHFSSRASNCHPRPLQASSLESEILPSNPTCHVTSRSEFQRDPLTLNGLRDSGSMLCRLHRQTKKSVHDTGSFIHKEHQASGGSLKSCRRYVSVQSKRVDRRSCMFFLVYGRPRTNSRGLTWPHLRNLFLKMYVKIRSKTSSKATNHFEELRGYWVTVIKLSKQIHTNSSDIGSTSSKGSSFHCHVSLPERL